MSNTLGHGLIHRTLCQPTFLEHQSKIHSGIPCNSSFQVPAASMSNQSACQMRISLVSTKFHGNTLNKAKAKVSRGRHSGVSIVPRAVLAADPASEVVGKFNLDGDSELQIGVSTPTSGSLSQVDIQVTNSNNSLILHWGAIRDKNKNWARPSRRPDGTKVYKNKALRTPFRKSGPNSSLTIEIDDPEIQAIEFLILDESRNKWFKNNGENFLVQLTKDKVIPNVLVPPDVSVPEDLVQIQAYLRWERKGKQAYTPEQEKEEYEAARSELFQEVARGTSIEQLRAKVMRKDDNSKKPIVPESNKIPDDLVQVQSYIRWEKAGKPNYSPDQQLMEFEEARKELQLELNQGTSLDEIRKKIVKGSIQTKVSKQLEKKKYFTAERIQRKKRDIMQFLNKYATEAVVKEKTPPTPQVPTVLELWSQAKEGQDGGRIMNKKIFKLGDKELLVLVTRTSGKTKVYVATDLQEPLVLHWALSQKTGEWKAPPPSILPPGSVLLDKASETQFVEESYGDTSYQVKFVEIELDEGDFKGMPFVLLSSGNWIKNNGSDFYVEFSSRIEKAKKDAGDGKGTAKALLDKIAQMESEAQKSFMHRFNIAADLMEWAKDAGELGLAGMLVWMRFMATRQLIWNKNYNVKPREISKAQDRLTDLLQDVYKTCPQYREMVRMIMSTVGRGGEGDVGQRIRDEILVIQRNNDCKGGMMEEWHQKLHNNTSPDDVVICQALIDYIKSDFNIDVYWNTLNSNGITKERLLSYDRAIHNEPHFRRDQKEGLLRDLGHYMRTLKAVHSGADLESAIANCMGYRAEGQGFMVGVQINPISGIPSGYPELLQFVLDHVEDKRVEYLLEGLLEARAELRPLLLKSHDRLRDLLFLDIALDSTVRTALERGYEELNNAEPEKIMYFISLVLENLALSSDNNEDLIYCLKGWNNALDLSRKRDDQWALYAKAVLDRTRLALASKGEYYHQVLQPSAEYLGSLLGVDQWAVNLFTEEVIRAGSAASLSSLLNRLDPVLRKTAHLGSWQVISPVEAVGYVVVVDELLAVQNESYERPTVLVAKSVTGEEEIPDGTVAVLTPDMPDVLSHVSVRARNSKVCFATCFDPNILADLQSKQGKLLSLKATSAEILYSEIEESELSDASSTNLKEDGSSPSLTLVRKQFAGRYAIPAHEFTSEMVGAKSRNISYLKGKVPSWVGIPTSVALPFGVFEKVLSNDSNQEVADKLDALKKRLGEGDFAVLGEIRQTVLRLSAPPQLVQELKDTMKSSGMPWPGDEGEQRWEQAWMAIKKVWGSKWNERAYFSTRKVKLDHDYLCMAVLVQEIINADYAFVIHTTNPSSGDSSEIYAEVVKGLGETLVGAYPGRALSFVSKKDNLDSPKVLGYPSKPIGLFIRRSIIFRSDSNGEDLEGYAGAGLYDSVPMDEEKKVVLDYLSDQLIIDGNFRKSILSSIARAGSAIEELYGSPQDIEGVVKDEKIFVVQTRPQM
ncbi:alpha-glucan water dikinase, chloroplastic [Magnolia sinica]|uniref:alpha-glucan water dikinase, chloroplastic n=1 Tax=Magnolia sinica TaxID=86752 RepID=UPI002658451E|nr:alpha-glucan water dikinase, chloroplastic [Magnolia sinica]XP_058088675.1 alpha-glucan water dikinase, chloroplastic [Magnolia sinica]